MNPLEQETRLYTAWGNIFYFFLKLFFLHYFRLFFYNSNMYFGCSGSNLHAFYHFYYPVFSFFLSLLFLNHYLFFIFKLQLTFSIILFIPYFHYFYDIHFYMLTSLKLGCLKIGGVSQLLP